MIISKNYGMVVKFFKICALVFALGFVGITIIPTCISTSWISTGQHIFSSFPLWSRKLLFTYWDAIYSSNDDIKYNLVSIFFREEKFVKNNPKLVDRVLCSMLAQGGKLQRLALSIYMMQDAYLSDKAEPFVYRIMENKDDEFSLLASLLLVLKKHRSPDVKEIIDKYNELNNALKFRFSFSEHPNSYGSFLKINDVPYKGGLKVYDFLLYYH